jgi:iron complex transport system substrate-binding protein
VPALDRLPARKRERAWLRRAGERSWFPNRVMFMKCLLALVALLALGASAPAPAQRIVSLMPSFTEDLCAIGAGNQLVGVTQYGNIECAKSVPIIANFSSIDSERVVQLHPDVIVGIPAQRLMSEPLRRAGISTVFFSDDSFSDLFDNLHELGRLSGHEREAQALVASLRARTNSLRASEHFKRRPTVFFVEQALPIWTVGPQSYISALIDIAGGRNAVQSLPRAYAQYSPEALVRLQPDAIVATDDAHLEVFLDREPWRSLRAVRAGNVFILRDSGILTRPGPRYNEGIAWLIERLRPIAK